MTDNFLGEIRLFSCNFAPSGWALCNGAVLQVQANAALYSLLGQNFPGGNGSTTFALPDLRGRVPICLGQIKNSPNVYAIGNSGGSETVALALNQIPQHTHAFEVYNGNGTTNEPNDVLAIPHVSTAPDVKINMYNSSTASTITLNAESVVSVGSGVAHNNIQPFIALNFCIALQGIYPQRP